MTGPLTNWAGNVTFGAKRVHRPSSVDDVQHLVAGSDRVRAIGTGHSFSRLADTTGDLVSVAGLPPAVDIRPASGTVTVAAGVRYGELAGQLHEAGYALHNMASLPHISVAGACATGTHGSGDRNGNLATAVSAMEMVTADGELITVRRGDGDRFAGSVIGLGCLGVVTSLTLDLLPTFDVEQYVYEGLTHERLADGFEEIVSSGYSVSLFTDWRDPVTYQVLLKRLAGERPPNPTWMGATLANSPQHPIAEMPADPCTQQGGVPGPWYERLPHFRLEFTPSSGEELQSEYFVPRRHAVHALEAVCSLGHRVAAVLQISEVRTIAADDLWMSPSYGRDSVAIHFTWVKDEAGVRAVLPALEERLAPFEARPHWGKIFEIAPDAIRQRFERLSDFVELMRRVDPTGKFRNEFVDRYF